MLHKQTETKSFFNKTNKNKQKQTALLIKPTETNSFVYKTYIYKEPCLPKIHNVLFTNRLIYRLNKDNGALFFALFNKTNKN